MNLIKHRKTAIFLSILMGSTAYGAECSDKKSMEVADEYSQALMNGEVFKRAKVLKRHHPSKRKEVASYIKAGDLYYTIYTLVSNDCVAHMIKRTKGRY
ncbi:hypothetical protein [Marinomonas mediterranea]|jgi:hypothetical protein|nr:hypothetical protein [Marinomonas mediterranea]WCN17635.1 hypothetical protein GV053_11500 [Marinomonas mediterranea MMB-1]